MATACLLLAVAASGCGSGPPVHSGGLLVSEEGRIAFTRATEFVAPDFESEIYAINVDGTGEERLTDSPGLDAFPSWSPDGQSVVFATDRDGNWELYAMDADGSGQRRLTNTPDQDESVSAWSPDGEEIAYVTDVIESPVIRMMKADGSHRRELTGGNWPSWSPDGERIVYTDYSGNEVGHLFVMDADGTDQRRLDTSLTERLTGNADGEEPAWSPRGDSIAFAADRLLGDWEIYVMDADGTDRRRLTDVPGNDHWPPTWSPGGGRIAFTHDGAKGGPGEIYVMNADGSGLTRLTEHPVEDSFPAWRP